MATDFRGALPMHKWTTACLHLNDGLKPKRGASMLLCMTRCPEIQSFLDCNGERKKILARNGFKVWFLDKHEGGRLGNPTCNGFSICAPNNLAKAGI